MHLAAHLWHSFQGLEGGSAHCLNVLTCLSFLTLHRHDTSISSGTVDISCGTTKRGTLTLIESIRLDLARARH